MLNISLPFIFRIFERLKPFTERTQLSLSTLPLHWVATTRCNSFEGPIDQLAVWFYWLFRDIYVLSYCSGLMRSNIDRDQTQLIVISRISTSFLSRLPTSSPWHIVVFWYTQRLEEDGEAILTKTYYPLTYHSSLAGCFLAIVTVEVAAFACLHSLYSCVVAGSHLYYLTNWNHCSGLGLDWHTSPWGLRYMIAI